MAASNPGEKPSWATIRAPALLGETTDAARGACPTPRTARRRYFILMNSRLILFLALSAVPAAAQTPPASGEAMSIHPEAKAAIDGLWSPYCPGMMLAVCTSPGGAMLRDSAQSWALQGFSHEAIIDRFVAEYGEEYRAEPLPSGTGLLAWLIPPVILLAGLGAVATVLARRRRTAVATAPAGTPSAAPVLPPEDEARLKAALKELDEAEEPVF